MISVKKRGIAIISSMLLLFGTVMNVSATETKNEVSSYSNGTYTYSIISYTPAPVEMQPARDDSWVKTITYVGYPNTDATQYCTCTVGLEDGVLKNTDYMWTGQNSPSKNCDVATGIYVQCYITNAAGENSSTSPYVTNSQSATKVSVQHTDTGSPTFYVRFRG